MGACIDQMVGPFGNASATRDGCSCLRHVVLPQRRPSHCAVALPCIVALRC